MHGGDDGELTAYGYPQDHVFDWTKAELESRIDIGEGERMPTLEALLQRCAANKQILLNIELKAPSSEAVASRYDKSLAAHIVCNLINKYRIASQTMISSFDTNVIKAVHIACEGKRDFVVQSLRNFDGGPDPSDYAIDESMQGVNLIYSQLSRTLVDRLRSIDQLLGVWYWTEQSQENALMYSRVFHTCAPIDLFYSDRPLEAIKARSTIYEQCAISE